VPASDERGAEENRLMLDLAQIEEEIGRLADLIDASQAVLPTYGFSDGNGRPHIEVDERGYHYVSTERGHEFDRWTTQRADVLLYAVFRSVTFELASKYELEHRVAHRDARRLLFQKQIEIMSVLSETWATRLSTEKEQLLQLFPYDDQSSERATLAKSLRDQGFSPSDASRLANERFPSPSRGTLEDGSRLRVEQRMQWENSPYQ
jgi:hypothetical protein